MANESQNARLKIESVLDWTTVTRYYMVDATGRFYVARIFEGEAVHGYHAYDKNLIGSVYAGSGSDEDRAHLIRSSKGSLDYFRCESQSDEDRLIALQAAVSACDEMHRRGDGEQYKQGAN